MVEHPSYPDDTREPVPNWRARPACRARTMVGRWVTLEPFDEARHAEPLWQAFDGEALNERIRWFGWPWLTGASDLAAQIEKHGSSGWSTLVFVREGASLGMASYMREDAANGVIETGAIAMSAAIARSTAATEGHAMMMRHAFELGYRRYEWKCDAANTQSRRAAARLGFTEEGTFRQHMVKHGRNRDTCWFSMLDDEWPRVSAALEAWLTPSNFDGEGRQRQSLSILMRSRGAGS